MKVTKIISIMLTLIFIIFCCSCDNNNNNSKKSNEQQELSETHISTTSQEEKQLQKLKDIYYETKRDNETLDCVYNAIVGSWSYGTDMENNINDKVNLDNWSNQSGIPTKTLKETIKELNITETLLSDCDAYFYVSIALVCSENKLIYTGDYLKKSLTDMRNIMAEDIENIEKNTDKYITDEYYCLVDILDDYIYSCMNYYTLLVECQSKFNCDNFDTYAITNFMLTLDEPKSECKNYNDQLSRIFN